MSGIFTLCMMFMIVFFGAKGMGEMTMVPTAAAIANAVYQVTGVRIRSLPITPEKVLDALQTDEKK